MNLVPTPELAPGICLICEAGHTHGDPAWVDTLRNFDVGRATYLTGRKYVCGACAARIAMAVGFFPPDEREEMKTELDAIASELLALQERAADMDAFNALIEKLTGAAE